MTRAKSRAVKDVEPGEATFGPKMLALNERQQKFVIALFVVKPGHGAAVRAARTAGFGTADSNPQTMASIASRLTHDERVLEAIREYGERFLKAAAPAALRALEKLILTPSHKDHGRAVAAVVDRIYPTETVHNLKVQHDVSPAMATTAAALKHIAELAAKVGLDVARLPPLIDVTPASKSETAA